MPLSINLKNVEKHLVEILPEAEAKDGWTRSEEVARCLRLLGRNVEASEWFQRAVDSAVITADKTGDGRIQLMAANYLRLAGRPEAMAPYLAKAHEMIIRRLDPDLPYYYSHMAVCAYLQGNLDAVARWTAEYRKYDRVKRITYRTLPGQMARAQVERDPAPVREALEAIERIVRGERSKPWWGGCEMSMFDWYEEGERLLENLK